MIWGFTTHELIAYGTQFAALVVFWARVEFTQKQQAKDIKLVKQALGFENGHSRPSFVRTDTCELMHHAKDNEMREIKDRLVQLEAHAHRP